jgi:predicted amidophosphoribosyltransferase
MPEDRTPSVCGNCGTELHQDDKACPGCGIPRQQALAERDDQLADEASEESFPASDPPAY